MPVVNGAQGAREKIKFEYGKAEVVTLRFANGKEVQGVYGTEFLFTTIDERIFLLPHEVAFELEKLATTLGQAQPIKITKTRGAKNATYWHVEPAAALAIPVRNGHSEPPSEMEAKLADSIALAAVRKNGVNGHNGAQAQEAPAAAGSVAKALGTLWSIETIDKILLVEEYARQRGMTDFQFSEDAIERISVPLSIGAMERSSR